MTEIVMMNYQWIALAITALGIGWTMGRQS